MLFALVSVTGMSLLPDTPRWYFAKGRYEEGDKVLSRLFDRSVEDPAVQAMRSSILSSIDFEQDESNHFRLSDLIWDRTTLKVGRRVRISFLILSFQQMMGKLFYISLQVLLVFIFETRLTSIDFRNKCHCLL